MIPGHRLSQSQSQLQSQSQNYSMSLSLPPRGNRDVTPPFMLHPLPNIIPLVSISLTLGLSLPLIAGFLPSSAPNTIRHRPRDRGGDHATVDDVSLPFIFHSPVATLAPAHLGASTGVKTSAFCLEIKEREMCQLTRPRRNRSAMTELERTRHPIGEKNQPPSSSAPHHEADDVFHKWNSLRKQLNKVPYLNVIEK